MFWTNPISLQLTKKDQGEYKATLKDDRGQDVTILELSGKCKYILSLFFLFFDKNKQNNNNN